MAYLDHGKRIAYRKPTELLEDMDSHGIYDAAMLDECDFEIDSVPVFSKQSTEQAIAGRGLGGSVHGPDDARFIYGWTTAEALAKVILDFSPWQQGRGTRFRACVSALREKGY